MIRQECEYLVFVAGQCSLLARLSPQQTAQVHRCIPHARHQPVLSADNRPSCLAPAKAPDNRSRTRKPPRQPPHAGRDRLLGRVAAAGRRGSGVRRESRHACLRRGQSKRGAALVRRLSASLSNALAARRPLGWSVVAPHLDIPRRKSRDSRHAAVTASVMAANQDCARRTRERPRRHQSA